MQMAPNPQIPTAFPSCIGRGTLVDTYHGPIPVEDLVIGDKIMTKDDGFQPVKWLGNIAAEARGRHAPVRIAPGTLGNSRSLIVSQYQPLLVSDWRAELLFGEREVLIPAHHLVNNETIWVQEGGLIDYFMILFPRHQVFYTQDSFASSFHPASPGLEMIGNDGQNRLRRALPALANNWEAYGAPARPILKSFEVRAMRAFGS